MSWAKVNEERREKTVPKVPAMPKTTGMGGAIERRIAKVGK